MGNTSKIQSISLGQGQGPVAEKLIITGKHRGDWVFLQNIELYGDLPIPVVGINTHRLFCDAACWDFKRMILEDQRPGEMNPPLPAMVFIPVVKMPVNDKRYISR